MPMPSWNMAIIAVFLIGIAFGYILQRDKIIATLYAVYVSLIISQTFSGPIQQFFHGDKTLAGFWINASIDPFYVKTGLFLIVIILLSLKAEFTISNKSKGVLSPLEIIAYSVMVAGLVMTTIFNFMPTAMQESIMAKSTFAQLITGKYIWWVSLPVVIIIISGFFNKKKASVE